MSIESVCVPSDGATDEIVATTRDLVQEAIDAAYRRGYQLGFDAGHQHGLEEAANSSSCVAALEEHARDEMVAGIRI
jgi:flagellar biosynthesis/type III secretory pathway protein FliH